MLQDTPDASMGELAVEAGFAFPPPRPRFRLVPCGARDPRRAEAERYVRCAFWRVHRATVRSLPAMLLTLRDEDERLRAVAGFRAAGSERLYLERYLELPIEAALAARTGAAVERASIVEIGSLACSSPLSAQRLLRLLPQRLRVQGYSWVVFTATRRVRDLLRIFDAPLLELCRATAERAADSGDDWGRYYDSDPRVLAGMLPPDEGRAR